MADVKVSALPELAAGDLDPAADFLLVSDMSASASKKMKASEMIRAALPYLSTFWDFTTGSLLPTVSFTRASTGWRYNSAGVLVPEMTDTPRFEHAPAALTPRGLLIEDARTNIALRSAELDNASWNKTRATITANAAVAPDGTTTMDKLVENTSATDNHFAQATFSVVSGNYYTASFYVKGAERTWLNLHFVSGFGAFTRSFFDVTAGAGGLGSVSADATAFIEHVGNDIYRCGIIAAATATGTGQLRIGLCAADGVVNYTGDGASGLYVWGGDVQEGSALCSHIPTTSASVTRAVDLALLTNPQVLSDRCWVIRARTPRRFTGGSIRPLVQIDNGTSDHYISVQWNTDNNIRLVSRVNGYTQATLNIGTVASDTDFTVAVRFADNKFAGSLNGGAIATALSGSVPVGLTTARVGRNASGNAWNSTIRTFETRRTATDAELPLLAA